MSEADEELFLFIDGDHREDSLMKHFSSVINSPRFSGVLVIDDINWSNGMNRAWQRIKKHPVISVSVETFRLGILVFGREIQKGSFVVKY